MTALTPDERQELASSVRAVCERGASEERVRAVAYGGGDDGGNGDRGKHTCEIAVHKYLSAARTLPYSYTPVQYLPSPDNGSPVRLKSTGQRISAPFKSPSGRARDRSGPAPSHAP